MTVLYSELEPYPMQWLRNLIEAKHIAEGIVVGDIRKIEKVEATQFHAFAGIGVWSHALRLAGWPDDVPVWTGSCPCQPFSVAGKGKGIKDERHLWPDWFRLIRQCLPPVIFGEQVASPAGRTWLNSVFSDLESVGYAVAGADLPAAGVGASHRRQRLYFVAQRLADAQDADWGPQQQASGTGRRETRFAGGGELGELGNTGSAGSQERQRPQNRSGAIRDEGAPVAAPGLVDGNLGLADSHILGTENGELQRSGRFVQPAENATTGFWADAEWIYCTDDRYRPVESGTFPLAYGITNRVGKLRAYGNAITPQVAATFIRAVIEG